RADGGLVAGRQRSRRPGRAADDAERGDRRAASCLSGGARAARHRGTIERGDRGNARARHRGGENARASRPAISAEATRSVHDHERGRRRMRRFTMLAFALFVWLAPMTVWAQDQGAPSTDWFHVSWQPGVLPSTIEGLVDNTSPFHAIDVRL